MRRLLNKDFLLSLLDMLLMRANIDNGFIEEQPKPEDWKAELGGTRKVYLPSSNWKKYRSTGERQKRENSSETMACVSYATHNAIEQKMNRMKEMVEDKTADEEIIELVKIFNYFELYDEKGEANCSDPYTAKLSNTSYRGNSYNNVLQSIRHNGVVAEKFWQTPEKYTWNEYYKNVDLEVFNKGKEFAEYVEVTHEWVAPNLFNHFKKFSPILTSVHAGRDWMNTNIEIKPYTNKPHNHAVDNDYYRLNEYNGIEDSYLPHGKKIAWDYPLGVGKIIDFKLKKPLDKEVKHKCPECGYEHTLH